MLLKIISIFCLLLAVELCEPSHIREDYCEDYCGNECKVSSNSETDKTCLKIGDTVVTDKYKLELLNRNLIVTWKLTPVNLSTLKKLDLSHETFQASKLRIKYSPADASGQLEEVTIVRPIDYMKALNINELNYYRDETSTHQIIEHEIDVIGGPYGVLLNVKNETFESDFFYKYFLLHMKNLKGVSLTSTKILKLHDETFKINNHVQNIVFDGLNLQGLKFKNMTNIRMLRISNCQLNISEFLSSTNLQNYLEILVFDLAEKLDLTLFAKYKNLNALWVAYENLDYYSEAISKTNLAVFICNLQGGSCHFNIGINGKRCPLNCKCSVEYTSEFVIDCTEQGLSNIPELPISHLHRTTLYFRENNLIKLPNISSEGFNNIKQLSLDDNNLTSLSITQLPQNLTYLDISNNNLTFLDDDVTQFISKLQFVSLSGNPWQCSCKYLKFLDYLRREKPFDYQEVLSDCNGQEKCRDHCTCCKDEETQKFTSHCNHRTLS